MRNVFRVDEPTGERWELALDLLRRGEFFTLGFVTFHRTGPTTVEALVTTEWNPPSPSEARARDELLAARSLVEELVVSDPGFREAMGESSIDYLLVDDYDTGVVALFKLVGDSLERP